MSYARRSTNWGCLTAFVLMSPVALIVFTASIMGGGGCEGREPPCVGDYTPMWIMLGAVVAVAIGLAFCINLLIAKVRSWRDAQNGS
jgi:hypothetical protein